MNINDFINSLSNELIKTSFKFIFIITPLIIYKIQIFEN